MLNQFLLLVESFLQNIEGAIGRRLRYWYYRRRLASCGKNVIIDPGVVFQNPEWIYVGSNIWFDRNSLIIAGPFLPKGRKFIKKSISAAASVEPGRVILSNGVHIAPFVVLQGHGGLFIGENITVAAGAKIYTLSHHYRNLSDKSDNKRYSFSTMAPPEDQFLIVGPVIIERNSAIGLNAVVLPGTLLREGTWLGVSSFIENKETDKNSVYKGPSASKL